MNDFDFSEIIMHTQDRLRIFNLQIVFKCKDVLQMQNLAICQIDIMVHFVDISTLTNIDCVAFLL